MPAVSDHERMGRPRKEGVMPLVSEGRCKNFANCRQYNENELLADGVCVQCWDRGVQGFDISHADFTFDKFISLLMRLEPVSVCENGKTRKRRALLKKDWEYLEHLAGREVSENEIWEYSKNRFQ